MPQTDFKAQSIIRDRQGYKGSTHQEDTTVFNLFGFNNIPLKTPKAKTDRLPNTKK